MSSVGVWEPATKKLLHRSWLPSFSLTIARGQKVIQQQQSLKPHQSSQCFDSSVSIFVSFFCCLPSINKSQSVKPFHCSKCLSQKCLTLKVTLLENKIADFWELFAEQLFRSNQISGFPMGDVLRAKRMPVPQLLYLNHNIILRIISFIIDQGRSRTKNQELIAKSYFLCCQVVCFLHKTFKRFPK